MTEISEFLQNCHYLILRLNIAGAREICWSGHMLFWAAVWDLILRHTLI